MALFSRRGSKGDDSASEAVDAPEAAAAGGASVAADDAATAATAAEAVPQVGISMSVFGAADTAAPAARRAAPTAPAPTESLPGLADNALLQFALASLPEQPQSADVMNVMRQALQGQLYVRAQGDVPSLIASGAGLNLAITTFQDKRFLLAFSGGAPLQASARAENPEGGGATSAIGQPAHAVFRTAVDAGYAGVYLDHASSGARLVLPIELIAKALDEGAPVPFELKTLLTAERTDTTPGQVAEALTRVPVWVAGGMDAAGQMGLAESRSEGRRRLEVYSHPLEVLAMGRGDRPLPLTPVQLGTTLAAEEGLVGIVVDAAGPWIELDRDALAPVIALAD